MKKIIKATNLFLLVLTLAGIFCQTSATAQLPEATQTQIQARSREWVSSLNLGDTAKESRVAGVITRHLEAVYSWNITHPYTTVPAGINPQTGNKLSVLDRKIIAQSALPDSVHRDLMEGLQKDLTPPQVELILDRYTIGKVAFTLKGYQAIVPDLTPEETSVILANLKQARAQAVDYKSMKSISGIFEIYKTKNEQYLNQHGRDWHQLFKNYVNAVKAAKAAAKAKN